jgi:hypothetical protein
MALKGILDAIEDAKHSGRGAWQSSTIMRGYELLGRHLGLFVDRVEIDTDEKIMASLGAGRKRAGGLVNDEEEEPQEDGAEEQTRVRLARTDGNPARRDADRKQHADGADYSTEADGAANQPAIRCLSFPYRTLCPKRLFVPQIQIYQVSNPAPLVVRSY